MSLKDWNVVDIVLRPGITALGPRVVLVLYDTGDIVEPAERETALRRKLAAYLEYVVSGQFQSDHPELAKSEVCVKVVCVNPPTAAMEKIEAIHTPTGPRTVIPVEVMTDAAFRHLLGWKPRPSNC